ncbi:MAG: hypothetical protein FD164_1952 [Nitrospirae bacterium]|nr:MAG: hypothetical protein FD164_1952 [Nitrospirota bacterium]
MKEEKNGLHYMSDRMQKKLLEFYRNSIPDHVIDAGKSHITLRLTDDLCNYRDYVVTICDVHSFFANLKKRREPIVALGGYSGEEAYMRNIALECLRWFKFVSPEEFREKMRYPNEP